MDSELRETNYNLITQSCVTFDKELARSGLNIICKDYYHTVQKEASPDLLTL